MIYQMIIGAWPLGLAVTDRAGLTNLAERLAGWLEKSLREAKQETSWAQPNTAYESACRFYLTSILDPDASDTFLTEAVAYVDRIAAAGALNSLGQVILRLTCPGIPDLYQGCDFWDFSLVDPDNRGLVDYEMRRSALNEPTSPEDLFVSWQTGHIKQRLIRSLLQLRADRPSLFERGRYLPLALSGPLADRLIAFVRHFDGETLVVVIPRLSLPLLRNAKGPRISPDAWQNTFIHLPQLIDVTNPVNVLTGETYTFQANALPAEQLLERFSICILLQGNRLSQRAEDEL
jgi:(1->4)-alpha-D-glucan 1-alpha-D-glucosylmutase